MQDDEVVHELEVHTDGAASLNDVWPKAVRSAGWCAVFLAHTPKFAALVGAMYGPAVCDPERHAVVGVSRLSSNAARLAALMFAARGICVAMQLKKEEQAKKVLPVLDASFVCDNMYALGSCSADEGCDQPRPGTAARRWSWDSRSVLSNRDRHVRAHSGNEIADVGAELGRRLHCTSLSRLREDRSAKNEGVPFSLYDALWWSDQLSKPDPLMDQGVARPVAHCWSSLVGAERRLGQCSHPFSCDRPSLEVQMHFERKKMHMRCCGFAGDVARAIRFFVFVVIFTWSPRLPCLGREGWKFGSGIVCVMPVIFLFCTPRREFL